MTNVGDLLIEKDSKLYCVVVRIKNGRCEIVYENGSYKDIHIGGIETTKKFENGFHKTIWGFSGQLLPLQSQNDIEKISKELSKFTRNIKKRNKKLEFLWSNNLKEYETEIVKQKS
jgi:hypothetical protein